MTNEFMVVGEHKENELELLVRGADGAYYDYNMVHEAISPVEPDENWVITEETDPETGERISTSDAMEDWS